MQLHEKKLDQGFFFLVPVCEATNGIHVNTENGPMKFLFGNQVMFVIFVFLKFVEVKTQTACSLRMTIRLHMLVIQVLHGLHSSN
jgi:hypothetical protein